MAHTVAVSIPPKNGRSPNKMWHRSTVQFFCQSSYINHTFRKEVISLNTIPLKSLKDQDRQLNYIFILTKG